MEIICKNVLRLKSGATFSDLLSMTENEAQKYADIIEICVPGSYAVSEKKLSFINPDKCFGCMNCIDNGEIKYINSQFVPSANAKDHLLLSSTVKRYFGGTYPKPESSANKLSIHSSKDETRISNPMAALFLWRLSANPMKTFFCSSPSWEISLPTTDPHDEREGHIDVTVISYSMRTICVLEGKATLETLLRDRMRNQWNRYYESLKMTAEEYGFKLLFFYSIGGNELGLYPDVEGIPHHSRRNEFYNFLNGDGKRFISLEAFRQLRARQISVDFGWNWEKWLWELYNIEGFVGILSGGIVVKNGSKFELKAAPWI